MNKEEDPSVLFVDGEYGSAENVDLAREKNIDLIATNLQGLPTEEIESEFEFSEDCKKILSCPAGHSPKSCFYSPNTKQYTASFQREHCESCPYKDQCRAKIFKKVARIHISRGSKQRAETEKFMKTEKFQEISRLRNGIETVPSNLRGNYHLDKLSRGKQRGKSFFGSKIAALNFTKLLTYRRGTGHYAQNPVIA